MSIEHRRWPARLLRGTIALTAASAALCTTAACSGSQPAATATSAEATVDVIMIIRHAEKPNGAKGAPGVDGDGRTDPKSLTAVGWQRARALVELFDPTPPQPVRAGLTRPTAIYAAAPLGNAGRRPGETVQPLAARLHITVDTRFGKGDEAKLANAVVTESGSALVCWQHEEIPAIVARLGTVTPAPPRHWPDSRFDLVWVFTRTGGGWRFDQVPELLMPDDSAKPAGGKPTDGSEPTDSKATDSKATDSKATGGKPTDSKPTDSKATDSKATDSKATGGGAR